MVSRVYTPLVQPYARKQGAYGNFGKVSSPTDEEQAAQGNQNARDGNSNNLQRQTTNGLQAVQYGVNQKIPLDAVIGDFKNTMSALGADDQTRSEVTAYLNVVRFQGAKDQPEVSYIKQTLRTAANSLDQFISKALGQPSSVVKEWVDALLMQNIDYKANLSQESLTEPDSKTTADQNNPDEAITTAENTTSSVSLSTKAQIKDLIESAKTSQKAGDSSQADQNLQDALSLLKDANRPDWEGKVWRRRGRLFDQNGQWEQAADAYQQSATLFKQAKLPEKQAQSLQAMASILEEHGQLSQAKTAYQQVVELDQQAGNSHNQIRSLNDLASVTLRQGDSATAVQTLQQAITVMQKVPVTPVVRSDIFGNLGAAHQQAQNYPEAIQAYQQALQNARQGRDRQRYSSVLQQLATTYVLNNQPDHAMATLRKLKAMENSQTA